MVSIVSTQPMLSSLPATGTSLSLKARGKKRARDEDEDKNDARQRGIMLAFVDKALSLADPHVHNSSYLELVYQFGGLKPSDHDDPYDQLDKKISVAPEMLKSWLDALTHAVAHIQKRHHLLLNAIFELPWAAMDDAFVQCYIRFISVLLAAKPEHLSRVLEANVKSLRWGSVSRVSIRNHVEITRRAFYAHIHLLIKSLVDIVPSTPNILLPILERHFPTRRDKQEAQVAYFQNVLKIVEYVPQLLEDILTRVIARVVKFDVDIQVDLERLEDEEGALDSAVFGLQFDDAFSRPFKFGETDAVPVMDAGPDASLLPQFDFDDLDADEDPDSDVELQPKEEEQLLDQHLAIQKLREQAFRLDTLLKIIFQHFEIINRALAPPVHRVSASMSQEATTGQSGDHLRVQNTLFDILISVFDRTILKTFKTRHVQFLLFWYSSLHPDFVDMFIGHLAHLALFDNTVPAVTKIACASYFASYISRASFIDAANVQGAVGLLCEWMEEQMITLAPSPTGSSASLITLSQNASHKSTAVAQRQALFYAVVQAVIYIFCFRWKDLILEDDPNTTQNEDDEEMVSSFSRGRKWLPQLEALKQAILSPLNPLKVCSPQVVGKFAQIAHHVHFAYCYNILEANKRQSEPSTPLASQPSLLTLAADARGPSPLVIQTLLEAKVDTHFPFDPYKLPLTFEYIGGLYRDFEAPEGLQLEDDLYEVELSDDEEEDESEGESSREGIDIAPGGSSSSDEAAFSASFDEMHLTPSPVARRR